MDANRINWLLLGAVSRIRVKNAFGPMIALAVPAMLIFAYFGHSETGWLKAALYGVATLCLFIAFAMFIYFALRRPEMLQSEDYQLRHQGLEIMRRKSGPIVIDSKSIERVATSADRSEQGRLE